MIFFYRYGLLWVFLITLSGCRSLIHPEDCNNHLYASTQFLNHPPQPQSEDITSTRYENAYTPDTKRLYTGLLKISSTQTPSRPSSASDPSTHTTDQTHYCPVLVQFAGIDGINRDSSLPWRRLSATFYVDRQCLRPDPLSSYTLLIWVKENSLFPIDNLKPSGYIAIEMPPYEALTTLAHSRHKIMENHSLSLLNDFDQAIKDHSLETLRYLYNNQNPQNTQNTPLLCNSNNPDLIHQHPLKQPTSSSRNGCLSYAHLVTFQERIEVSVLDIIRLVYDAPMYSQSTPSFFQNQPPIAQDLITSLSIYDDTTSFFNTHKTFSDYRTLPAVRGVLQKALTSWLTFQNTALNPKKLSQNHTFFLSSHTLTNQKDAVNMHDIHSLFSTIQATPYGLSFEAKEQTLNTLDPYAILVYKNTPIATFTHFNTSPSTKIPSTNMVVLRSNERDYETFMSHISQLRPKEDNGISPHQFVCD